MRTNHGLPRLAEVNLGFLDRRLVLVLHETDDQYISEEIARFGVWEPLETELVRRLLGGDDVFIDCGANLGWYSVIAAALGAEVIAFEPDPANVSLLRANVERNGLEGRVEIRHAGAGAARSRAALSRSASNQGDHRLTVEVGEDHVEVDIETLDEVLRGRSAKLVKIDTQGSEVAIIRGAADLVHGRACAQLSMIVEYWPHGLESCGSSAEELVGLLASFVGVSHICLEVDEKAVVLRRRSLADLATMARIGDLSPGKGGHTNLLLVPNDALPLVEDLVEREHTPEDAPDESLDERRSRQLALLAASECSVHSQNGEDGVIEYLVGALEIARTAVELGAGSGVECNTRRLKEADWHVFAVDGDPEGSDWVTKAFVTAENVNELLEGGCVHGRPGLLTIDLDGNDYWILRAIDDRWLPDVLVAEYNATVGPVAAVTVPYRAGRRWDHSNYFGASLSALVALLSSRGLDLVYCDRCGVNAFFVRRELMERAALVRIPADVAYRPPRYGRTDSSGRFVGHEPTSRRWISVETSLDAARAWRVADAAPGCRWAARVMHHVTTSDLWTMAPVWTTNALSRWRGGGPTK